MLIKVKKKNGLLEDFDRNKIIKACKKSSSRVMQILTNEDYDFICREVESCIEEDKVIQSNNFVTVEQMHKIVESVLMRNYTSIGESYRQYRNYKLDFASMMDSVYEKSQTIRYIGDVSNANTDSTMVSTQRSLIYGELNKQLYRKFFLNEEEKQAIDDGYIYIHDLKDRLDGFNCMLFDMANVLSGGFEMGNVWYNEPKTLDVAFDVVSDVTMSASSQIYGGFTIPEVDKLLLPYAKKSFEKYYQEYIDITNKIDIVESENFMRKIEEDAKQYATNKVRRDIEQGFQSWEYRFNTVGSSRGDYPFITITFGLETHWLGKMLSETILKVRMGGQGRNGHKKPVLFPKLVFLYDKELHSKGKPLYDLFEVGIGCSSRTMYPDWLSLTGDGYVSDVYKKYNKVISPMGCVDGNEVITYKYNDVLFVESFERMWNRLSKDFDVYGQQSPTDENKIISLKDKNIQIYDTKKGFVEVYYLIRNVQDNWCNVKFSNGKVLNVTTDHPFETNRGVVFAEMLNNEDILIHRPSLLSDRYANISVKSVELLPKKSKFSYDVTTESEHFEVSSIYSHNCRAFLSLWFESGNKTKQDKNDNAVFVGRFNMGAITLNLPMIYAKAKKENKDFYDVLLFYLEMIRRLHIRTYDYLGDKKASTNPLCFTQGGVLGGNLNPEDKIRPLLKAMTMSFGITALNELQQLHNQKSLFEDNQFSLEVMDYINQYLTKIKEEDDILYACYGTPAESLCHLQVQQFRKKFGIVKNVSDREYFSNSFHCHVTEDITPIEKQNREKDFWNLFNGGKIQYCKYPISYNRDAITTLVERAMDMGFYEGINLSLAYCENCGYEELDMSVCPKCDCQDITKINRMNGYLGFTKIKGKSRFNNAKVKEIEERVSM